jgi:hypothetical protein
MTIPSDVTCDATGFVTNVTNPSYTCNVGYFVAAASVYCERVYIRTIVGIES